MDASYKVLLIEDDQAIRRFLRVTLVANGFQLVESETASDGIVQCAAHQPDLVLLDLGLPDMDGTAVIGRLREWSRVPIVVLSARGQEGDKVRALDLGADDYLTKPFGVGELLARIRVALRHAATQESGKQDEQLVLGWLRIDRARRRVEVDGNDVHLTPIEYRLLAALARHVGKVLTHRQILMEVWGPNSLDELQYLRVYMGHLRHKIERDPSSPKLIMTEPGVGYRLVDPDERGI